MLIVKGTRVAFEMTEGGEVVVRPRCGMMHDPQGSSWGKCSLLVGPFNTGRSEPLLEVAAASLKSAQQYFGRNYVVREGSVELPPRALSGWERLGPVDRIWYTRGGTKYPGPFKHPFGRPGVLTRLFKGAGKKPILYTRGAFLRLEMQSGCMLDDRGILFP
jgi:hypothetical protein